LRDLSRPEKLEYTIFRDCAEELFGDEWVVDETLRVLPTANLDFAFVYLGTVDNVGHAAGWMSETYLQQATRMDVALGRLLAALPADTHVLIQADHGGHDRTHGTDSVEDMTIPWIVAGPRIRQNHALTTPVSLLDTAPTLAHLLGLAPHHQWEGKVITEAFM
jgi:phosphopentomutase